MTILNKIIHSSAFFLRNIGFDFKEDKDPRIVAMRKEIANLGGKVEFKIEQYPDGSWTAESTNVDGIITGGSNMKNISFEIKDATFTYFGIPTYLCKDDILKSDNEPVTVMQKVYA